jgi:hypothetical protein
MQGSTGRSGLAVSAGLALCVLAGGCSRWSNGGPSSIQFTRVPPASLGGPIKLDTIQGRVVGARPGQHIVLFARSGAWWVQPLADEPLTKIKPDSTWSSSTHLGTEYAALLVSPEYKPPTTAEELPGVGGPVIAVATTKGREDPGTKPVTLHWSGYDWEIRQTPSDRGGLNDYEPTNASVDTRGGLHLRIVRGPEHWTSAEVRLTRSLGYGTYTFLVRDTGHLDVAAAFSMFTWDDLGFEQSHREVGIDLSRWGDPAKNNGQFVIQPYYVPANVFLFAAPEGPLTHSFHWEAGRVSFRTVAGTVRVSEHTFASGVPVPGGETVHLNLSAFRYGPTALQSEAEVVVEKFEFLP